ncbi:hypothetical protein [Microvirga sp. G4-2]|uniref:hypothetical protein n=1 Tax=Microvirga sp. G4-2 TaxID=3434467 RepID=UPI0040447264
MTLHLLGCLRPAHSGPALKLTLRAATAIQHYLPDGLSPFDPPDIAWRRSPGGMALIQPIRCGESEHVLLRLDRHWQPLQGLGHVMAAVLAETELEYEVLRPIEPRALVVQPRDASLGLPPGEDCRLGSSLARRYGAADIDRIRNLLYLTASGSTLPRQGAVSLLAEKPLTLEAEARAWAIVTAWDQHQADDVMALARSGLAVWRRIAGQAGYSLPSPQ